MSEPTRLARMAIIIERGEDRERKLVSVPVNRDLSVFVGNWQFPRVVGRVLEDGRINYDQPLALQ